MININKSWTDWAVKHAWPLVKYDPRIHPYFDVKGMNQEIWPDQAYLWGVCSTILPDWSKKYYEAVQRKRHALVSERVDKTKIIVISDAWRKRLTEFNYKPESK